MISSSNFYLFFFSLSKNNKEKNKIEKLFFMED